MSWDIPTQWLQPQSPRSKRSYLSWDILTQWLQPLSPNTVATAPESQVRVVLSVLGCPRVSWEIPTQWLQPQSPRSKRSYLSWDVPGCPGISRHSGYSPRVQGPRGPICPGMSQDILGYPDTVATAPESQVQEILSVLGCPWMSWDIPTQWLQPQKSQVQEVLSALGCPGISRHSGYIQPLSSRSKRSYISVLGCPRMSWDIPTQWLQPQKSQVQEVLSALGCTGISRHSGYIQPLSPRSKRSYISVLGCPRMSWDIPTQWLQPLSTRSK